MKDSETHGQVPFGFEYHFELERDGVLVDEWVVHNLVPLQGLNYIAAACFGDVTAIGSWYVGVFTNNYIPSETSVAADFPATMGEFSGYSEVTRPAWDRVNTDGTLSNVASRATFTVTSNARLYGGVLLSSSVKASGSGTLLSAARFPTPRDIEAGMVLRVRAEVSFIPTSVV